MNARGTSNCSRRANSRLEQGQPGRRERRIDRRRPARNLRHRQKTLGTGRQDFRKSGYARTARRTERLPGYRARADRSGAGFRFDDGFVDEASVIQANADGYVELMPVTEADKPEKMWMVYTAPLVLGTDLKAIFYKPRQIRFCDFASAGNTWDRRIRYRVWLKKRITSFWLRNSKPFSRAFGRRRPRYDRSPVNRKKKTDRIPGRFLLRHCTRLLSFQESVDVFGGPCARRDRADNQRCAHRGIPGGKNFSDRSSVRIVDRNVLARIEPDSQIADQPVEFGMNESSPAIRYRPL